MMNRLCRRCKYSCKEPHKIIYCWKFAKKEVKKVNKIPYFELKVVKVKKQPKDSATIYNQCPICKEIHKCNFKKKGNWVNGENLDKIKFPCFCRWGGSQYGMITRTKANEAFDNEFYTLHSIGKQYSSVSSVRSYYNFADLITVWDIHILKGKIIIFEEEE